MGQVWLLLCLWLTIAQSCLRPPSPPPPPTSAPTTSTSSNCRCGERKVVRTRIVGGQNAQKNEYPWQVGLVSNWGSTPFCGGSLISSTTIVTAAHCATSLGIFASVTNVVVMLMGASQVDAAFYCF